MPVYSYRATSLQGEIVEGVIEAAEEKAAIERLKSTGVIPLRVSAPKETSGLTSRLTSKLSFRLGSRRADVLTFTAELSALLSAGLALDRSLNILSGVSESKAMQETILSVLKSIREGSAFSTALENHPKVFSNLYVNMIKAGEAGGVIDVVLDKLAEFQESNKELRDHVLSAMIYPIILLITGCASVVLLLTFVMPRFSVIFAELGGNLPLPTQVLLAVSNALRDFWWVGVGAIIAAWVLLRRYLKTEAGRLAWDRIQLKALGDIIVKLETARFCRTLGTLLRSGVSLLQALTNAKDVVTNRVIAASIDAVSSGAKEGRGIAQPLSDARVLPQLALSMIQVGEETGQLDTMLIKVAATYERSLRESIKRFIGFLEPAIILGMGLLIGFMVVSILTAIFSITQLPF